MTMTSPLPVAPRRSPPRRARWADILLAVAVLALALRIWVLEPVEVSTASMSPTIEPGSYVLVDRLGPRLRGYDRSDVVALSSPVDGSLFVKRVVGVAGDDVAILDGVLHVDGAPAHEPWADPRAIDSVYTELGVVPRGHVVVLGDRRGESIDSRDFGPVPLDALEGRVMLTLWPLSGGWVR
ncbi:MAG: signal peptidase I [Dermatophilaceae bacterium]